MREGVCVSDIEDFLVSNVVDEVDDVDELQDLISKVEEIGKEFRHAHAELKFYLDNDTYVSSYSQSIDYPYPLRKVSKEAKEKIRILKRFSSQEAESKKYVSEEQYLCDKLDRMTSKLVPEEIGLVSELEQSIGNIEFHLEEYYKIHSHLKTILGSDYDDGKLEKVQDIVEQKLTQCKDRIQAIRHVERKVEEERMNEAKEQLEFERREMEKRTKIEDEAIFFVAKETSEEITLRSGQLKVKFAISPSSLGDHQLFQLDKDLHDLDIEFNNILTRITEFSKMTKCKKSIDLDKLVT